MLHSYKLLLTRRCYATKIWTFKEATAWQHSFNQSHIPKDNVSISFSRSSGPGGQNVNKGLTTRLANHSPRLLTTSVHSEHQSRHETSIKQSPPLASRVRYWKSQEINAVTKEQRQRDYHHIWQDKVPGEKHPRLLWETDKHHQRVCSSGKRARSSNFIEDWAIVGILNIQAGSRSNLESCRKKLQDSNRKEYKKKQSQKKSDRRSKGRDY